MGKLTLVLALVVFPALPPLLKYFPGGLPKALLNIVMKEATDA